MKREKRAMQTQQPFVQGYISIDEAAQYLDVKTITLRNWIKSKKIPAYKIGKLWKFKISELEEWVSSGKSAY